MTTPAAIRPRARSRNRRLAPVPPLVMAPPYTSVRRFPSENVKLLRPPRRAIRPTSQRLCRPRRRLVGVTQIAGVWNFHRVGLRRPYETEGVAADHNVAEGLGDLRHVAGDALATG